MHSGDTGTAGPAIAFWKPVPAAEPDPDGVHDPAVAEGWATYYTRLIAFESSVLAHMRELAESADPEMAEMIAVCDIAPMRALIAHFGQRLAIWSRRTAALLAAS